MMSIKSLAPFVGGFLVFSLLLSVLLARLTRSRDILWPVWVLVTYNLGWDAIIIVFGIKKVHQVELQLFAVLVGLVLGMVFLMSVPKFFRLLQAKQLVITRFDLLMLLLPTTIGLLGLTIGGIYGNNIGYLASDTYKLLILSGTYFVGIVNIRKVTSARVVFGIVVALILLQQLFDVLQVAKPLLSTGSYVRVADQFWMNRLLLFPLLGLAMAKTNSVQNRMIYGFALILTIVATLLSLYRTGIILGVISFFLALSPRTTPFLVKNLITVALVIALSGGLLFGILQVYGHTDFATQAWSFVFGTLGTRFNEMLEGGGGVSIQVKFVEAQSVVDEFLSRGSFLNWFTGFGSGAEYDASTKSQFAPGLQRYQEVYGLGELTHHIHNVFVASLLRYGIIGTLVLVVLLLIIWDDVRKLDNRLKGTSSSVMLHTILIYFLVTLVVMNLFSSFWGDVNWGILLALASVQARSGIINRRKRLGKQYSTASAGL